MEKPPSSAAASIVSQRSSLDSGEEPSSIKSTTKTNSRDDAAAMLGDRTASREKAIGDGKARPDKDESANYVTGYKLAIVVASICLSCFLMLLDTMIITTAIPRITDAFNSLPDIGWYASAYQFGSAAPQPLIGKIYTHFKLKWTYLVFFLIFELGSVLCGAATSSNMLIVGRAVAGFGAAGILNGAITIVSSCAPLEKRPGLIGIIMGFNQLGIIAGPLIGGALTSYSTWRWCFYINLPVGFFAAIAVIVLHIPEQTPKSRALAVLPSLPRHLDLIGFVLFAGAVLELLLALQYGGVKYAWKSSQVIGLFCGSAATIIAWFVWNGYQGEDALIPHSMIKRREVVASSLYQAFMMAAIYGAVFYLPIYFQAIRGATPMLSGVYLLPIILPQLFMGGLSGAIIQRIGYVMPMAILSTVLLTTASGLYSLLQPGTSTGEWVGFQILGGLGSGAGLQAAIISIQAVVSDRELASAMALLLLGQSLGAAIVLVLCNVVFNATLVTQLSQHAPQADAADIIHKGATGFRASVKPEDLAEVLAAYANSIDRVFYLVAGIAGACGLVVWMMGWHDIRKKEDGSQAEKSGESGN